MISITQHANIFKLTAEHWFSQAPSEVWEFFSSPKNLEKITPAKMGFNILNDPAAKAYPGQIIVYKISIFPLFKSTWVTEITQVKDNEFFIDEQRFGPYSMWHHEHHFTPKDGGTMMKDIIHIKMPLGILGRLAFKVYAKKEITKIFEFRAKSVADLFQ